LNEVILEGVSVSKENAVATICPPEVSS